MDLHPLWFLQFLPCCHTRASSTVQLVYIEQVNLIPLGPSIPFILPHPLRKALEVLSSVCSLCVVVLVTYVLPQGSE